MRINKFLALAGLGSRRKVEELVTAGKIKVNGKVVKDLSTDIKDTDIVYFGTKPVKVAQNFVYYKLHKPKGYVTTVEDDKERKTVMDLLPPGVKRVFPVGRLDYDSEGLLILTNDGDLTYKLTHPKNEVPKTYLVKTEKPINEESLGKLRSGVYVDGVKTKKCNVKLVETNKNYSKLHITITEGRNRQVRKMLEAVGNNVDFLKRIKIGDLKLTGLDRGQVRKLNSQEINYLLNF